MRSKIMLVLVGAFLVTACARAGTAIDRIVAVVGDDVITLSELQTEMAPAMASVQDRFVGDDLARETKKLKNGTLNHLIDRVLQIQQARLLGISIPKEDVDAAIEDIMVRNNMDAAGFDRALATEGYSLKEYRDNLQSQLMIMRLVNREVGSKVVIEESEVSDYYEANKDKYAVPDSVTVAQIFFPAEGDDMDAAKQNALKAKKTMDEGASFEKMAVQCTGDPKSETNCVLGTFGRGELSGTIEGLAFGMEAGEVSEPLVTEGGYQLIKVTQRTPAGMRTLEEARADVVEALRSQKGEAIYANWLQDLRKNAYIEIRD